MLKMVLSFIRLTEIPVPGVTNGKQVIRISDSLEKADMMQLLMGVKHNQSINLI
jgi:hypothetical protein